MVLGSRSWSSIAAARPALIGPFTCSFVHPFLFRLSCAAETFKCGHHRLAFEMIRHGRTKGLLRSNNLADVDFWAKSVDIEFHNVEVRPVELKGSGIIAKQDLVGGDGQALVVVPRELVLSLESIETRAKSDEKLRELLAAIGDFGRTTRGAILAFLLQQSTYVALHETSEFSKDVGVYTEWANYNRFLPLNILPTSWPTTSLLDGTTLKPALEAKMKSLRRDFDTFRKATMSISWCAKHWWGRDGTASSHDILRIAGLSVEDDAQDDPEADESNGQGLLTFDDWLQVDFLYRSRGLEFPGIGDCLVPCIDMVNHQQSAPTLRDGPLLPADGATAYYECNNDGNAVLVLRDGAKLNAGDEVTISYGDSKGACEMLFSYGFIPDDYDSDAKVMFLDLEIPDDDPLAKAKMYKSKAAPGFRISSVAHELRTGDDAPANKDAIEWEGDFVWCCVVNEEDGLEFKVLQSTDGEQELRIFWKGEEIEDVDAALKENLTNDELWPLFQLRAVVFMQSRIEAQLEVLRLPVSHDARLGELDHIAEKYILLLRKLEQELLEKADQLFEQRVRFESRSWLISANAS